MAERATGSATLGSGTLLHLDEVDSTNSEAMRRAAAGATPPLWVLAARQTAGRGRSSRAWASLDGNLNASLLISLACPVSVAAQLSLVAGVAAIDAMRDAAPEISGRVRLKWPNDLLLDGAKLGGILVESSEVAGCLHAVVGFGINLAASPSDLARAVTCLAQHGAAPSPPAFQARLADAMSAWLEHWNEGCGFTAVRSAWMDRAGSIGEPLRVHAGTTSISGRFAGLDVDGSLLLAMDGNRIQRVAAGDVTLGGEPAERRRQEE